MQEYDSRILFVEDDADTADLVSTILKYSGCKTVIASTAAEAMQLAVGPHFQLIIVEWLLEDGRGPELCRRLKDYDGETPVFLYTGNAFRPDLQMAVEVGAEGCIDSPVGIAELPHHIHVKRQADELTGQWQDGELDSANRTRFSSPSSPSGARKTKGNSRLF